MTKTVRRYVLRAPGSFGRATYGGTECSDQSVIASRTRQQPASRFSQATSGNLRTKVENARKDFPYVLINGHQALGMELAKRNMKRPSVCFQHSKTVQRKMDAFPETNAGRADEQQRVRVQIIHSPEFLL